MGSRVVAGRRVATGEGHGDALIATIVVGTDGSQTAGRAVALAADLARGLGARLHLVNGYHDPAAPLGVAAPVAAVSSPVWHEVSESLLEEARADPCLAGLSVECHAVSGGPSHAIVEVAREVGADLIVVGNRGIRGAGGQRLESVPEAVVHLAPCHVLIAKTT
jgi:nucleotide-binding universal stress UspA family protein